MKWQDLVIWSCIVHTTEACFDDGEFYCAKLWYFWFVVFFVFVFILIGAIITTNLCTKKKRRVGARGAQRKRRANARKKGSKASILAKRPSDATSTTTASPQLSEKIHVEQSGDGGEIVASKRYFSNKKNINNKAPIRNTVTASAATTKTATKHISNVESGNIQKVSGSSDEESNATNTTSILTTRDLPTSLVMEVDETNHGNSKQGGHMTGRDGVNDTNC